MPRPTDPERYELSDAEKRDLIIFGNDTMTLVPITAG
jgi:hypothetical protein